MPRAFTDDERVHIRDALLRAGQAAVQTAGLRRTPVAQLCREAGISKGAFYLFFESKEALAIEMLLQAEASQRAALRQAADRSEGALSAVLGVLFDDAFNDPALALLADPDEAAWLMRGLPPGALDEARADDDAFFAEIFALLQAKGEIAAEADVAAFAGLAVVAMAVAQQAELLA
ncbi:MAG: TetR/AcrR family transcriptional regulator, partial [Myxococcales bacterium]|nr:TetR/AcrR family transcriptional regulator [Myxococcales bacterium]